jgi:hypothetical protein
VCVHTVETDDRRRIWIAPLVQIQLHLWEPNERCSLSCTTFTATSLPWRRC